MNADTRGIFICVHPRKSAAQYLMLLSELRQSSARQHLPHHFEIAVKRPKRVFEAGGSIFL
ncbi:MAG: hypothetical protein WKF92_11800 [Pyrinomonadaceae bacterium]